jgi:uncharacterized protein (TIGR03067 family)
VLAAVLTPGFAPAPLPKAEARAALKTPDRAEVIPMMRRSVILLTAALALGLAPAPLPRQPGRDAPSLTGEWQVVSWRMQITDSHAYFYEVPGVRIAGDRLEWRQRGEFRVHWTFSLDPLARVGRVTLYEGRSERTILGIYKLEGATLTICYRGPDDERPYQFHNKGQWMLVLKRRK